MSTSTLQKLLDEKKFDEAKRYIEEALSSGVSDQEKVDYVNLAEAYLDVMNDINDEYIGVLQDAVKALEQVKKSEKETASTFGLMEVRAKLNSQ